MENNTTEQEMSEAGGQGRVSTARKFFLEFKDILIGTAFPFMLTLVISSTILLYADYTADIAISLIALIGGEIMLIGALVLFGRANGGAAYKNTTLHMQKRELGVFDEKTYCKTGEYALWKGALIGFVLCVPFIIFQTVELIVHNNVCTFFLKYMCGWAYFPFSYFGSKYQPLNYIWVAIPVVSHTVGYYLGKIRQKKIQDAVAARETVKSKKRSGK